MPDQKQLLHELSDRKAHRVGSGEHRKDIAAVPLQDIEYAQWVGEDGNGGFYRRTPGARRALEERSEEWESAKKKDGIPDESIFDQWNELERDEQSGRRRIIAMKIVDDLDRMSR